MEDDKIKVYGSSYIRRINNIKSYCNKYVINNDYLNLFKFLQLLNIEVLSICNNDDRTELNNMHETCYKSYLDYKRMQSPGRKVSVTNIRKHLFSWQQKIYDIIHNTLDVEIQKSDYSLEEF